MKIVLFSVPGSPPLIANILKEEDDYITVEYPLALLKETPHVYTFQYMPFAKEGIVVFRNNSIVSVSTVSQEIQDYYKEMVELYKNQKLVFKTEDLENQHQEEHQEIVYNPPTKTLH